MTLRRWAYAALAGLAACAPVQREPDLFGPALVDVYARTAAAIEAEGGLRTERNPPDAPITRDLLVRNFERIAFFSETFRNGRQLLNRSRPITLTRWEGPIRLGVIFGDSVPEAQRRRDLRDVEDLLSRYRSVTGRDIRYVPDGDINFLVLVLERQEQFQFAQAIEETGSFPISIAGDLRNSAPSVLCWANLISAPDRSREIVFASALIKAEHRGTWRTSCFHEELTQALGLVNDNFAVRPSIFNDDEEFAFLTLHDEILLRMLYDPRLYPGMTLAQARPLLPQIAADAARAAGLRPSS
ncbi:MAG: DUF2927 domain-containing protein [Pseudomonadota bacterium]